jgi:hypothetical protein
MVIRCIVERATSRSTSSIKNSPPTYGKRTISLPGWIIRCSSLIAGRRGTAHEEQSCASERDCGRPCRLRPGDAAYEPCLFAGTAATIVGEARVAPDAQRWRARSDTGYRYRDPAGSADGIQKLLLKGSPGDRTKIVLKGKGSALPDPVPPVALPLIVQLRNTDTDICWSAIYTEADVNESGKLKAKALALHSAERRPCALAQARPAGGRARRARRVSRVSGW